MGKCLIFCAGEFGGLLSAPTPEDFLIAADAGLLYTRELGLEPDLILGDFDSLGYTPAGAKVYPVRKDDTDSMLAIREGLRRGFREFVLYGALDGRRADMALANFQSLLFLACHGGHGILVGKDFLAAAVRNGSLEFPAGLRGTVSVFCLGSPATGVTLEGLSYPLTEGCLTADFPLGVSNSFLGTEARIAVREGSLLVLWKNQSGADRCRFLDHPDTGEE